VTLGYHKTISFKGARLFQLVMPAIRVWKVFLKVSKAFRKIVLQNWFCPDQRIYAYSCVLPDLKKIPVNDQLSTCAIIAMIRGS